MVATTQVFAVRIMLYSNTFRKSVILKDRVTFELTFYIKSVMNRHFTPFVPQLSKVGKIICPTLRTESLIFLKVSYEVRYKSKNYTNLHMN